jgi:hypothetical protein
MEKVAFCLTEMAWNKGSRFWLDWNSFKLRKLVFGVTACNGMEWRKSVLAFINWLGTKEDFLGLTEIAWNRGSQFWLYWNGLEYRNSVLVSLEWLKMSEVGFVLTGMD